MDLVLKERLALQANQEDQEKMEILVDQEDLAHKVRKALLEAQDQTVLPVKTAFPVDQEALDSLARTDNLVLLVNPEDLESPVEQARTVFLEDQALPVNLEVLVNLVSQESQARMVYQAILVDQALLDHKVPLESLVTPVPLASPEALDLLDPLAQPDQLVTQDNPDSPVSLVLKDLWDPLVPQAKP